MSKIQAHYGYPDITTTGPGNPDDHGYPGQKEEPSAAEFALVDLDRAVADVKANKHDITLGGFEELYAAINTLKKVAEDIKQYREKPF